MNEKKRRKQKDFCLLFDLNKFTYFDSKLTLYRYL